MPLSFFTRFFSSLFVFMDTEHLQSFIKKPWLSIFDDLGQSFYFSSCCGCFNLCTGILYRHVWSMNSKEWLQAFYAFNFFVKCFNVNLQNIKRGILQALWKNLVHSQTFWKVHARSQSKFTKVRFKKIYCFKSDFYKSVIHQKPLRAISGGSVCGKSVLASCCCQWTPKLCCLHLPVSYWYCLLCLIAVNANKLLQKLKCRQQSSVLAICHLHTQGSLLN